jgi:hypothetical protein
LWSLIAAAGGIDDDSKGAELRHAIRITAKDGYVVVTSTGEIAPDFGGKTVLVAYERDGKPLDGFRIVMPGDKHGGRNVRDVTTIGVHRATSGRAFHRASSCLPLSRAACSSSFEATTISPSFTAAGGSRQRVIPSLPMM